MTRNIGLTTKEQNYLDAVSEVSETEPVPIASSSKSVGNG